MFPGPPTSTEAAASRRAHSSTLLCVSRGEAASEVLCFACGRANGCVRRSGCPVLPGLKRNTKDKGWWTDPAVDMKRGRREEVSRRAVSKTSA